MAVKRCRNLVSRKRVFVLVIVYLMCLYLSSLAESASTHEDRRDTIAAAVGIVKILNAT